MNILKELKEFSIKGNVVDMAVGVMIGAAFATIINSLVQDILSPVIGLFSAKASFSDLFILLKAGANGGPYNSLADAKADAAITMNIGLFLNAFINFSIVTIVLFLIVKATNRLRRPQAATTDLISMKECPFCFSSISVKALRCPLCTSDLANDSISK